MPDSAELLEEMRQKLEFFERANRAAEARAAGYDAMGTELRTVEASVQSPDRSVTVVAGLSGSIKEIRFTEDAKRLSATQLSQAVMSTLQQAVAAAARQQAEIVQGHVGTDIPIAERVAKTQQEIFGQPGEPPARPRPPVDDDGDTGSIFRQDDRW
ncbi:YbaB/EbfC family nucleoid-associated protein [Lentzea sp. BCCO 10_0856]|uniref:YbaB/EbfC family nucleoid-associated protein n=1 Tax=Lentzea miocenica TaxID=3095431 RepID=A0ABU4T0G1_9PSEU|nr:YbaB/EbfC family nucleoid-associated protein [Lentzea sp. BCCO 10_0856]MDX8031448.1 YbaB/EbfC family nucleoid-associated protein [Lentzea sp. BCCO 10_0856]